MKRFTMNGHYAARRSAQAYLHAADEPATPGGACGSACGAGEDGAKPSPQPAACGSACGAGEK